MGHNLPLIAHTKLKTRRNVTGWLGSRSACLIFAKTVYFFELCLANKKEKERKKKKEAKKKKKKEATSHVQEPRPDTRSFHSPLSRQRFLTFIPFPRMS